LHNQDQKDGLAVDLLKFAVEKRIGLQSHSFTKDDTPLHVAAHYNQPKAAEDLLALGAHVDIKCSLGQTPLHLALAMGHQEMVETLIRQGSNIDARDNNMENCHSLLCKTTDICSNNNVQYIKLLSSRKAEGNGRNYTNRTGFHRCARNGHFGTFAYFIRDGRDHTARDVFGWTPIDYGLQWPRLRAHIFALGLQPDYSDQMSQYHHTILHRPLDYMTLKCLLRGLKHRGLEQLLNFDSRTEPFPLCVMAITGATSQMTKYIDAGVNINFCSRTLGTALNAACSAGRLMSVRLLIRHGANLESVFDEENVNAVQASQDHPDVVDWLLVRRYTEQPKLTSAAHNENIEINPWTGIRQIEVPMDKWHGRRYGHSLIDHVRGIHSLRKTWRQKMPPTFDPVIRMVPLPGEVEYLREKPSYGAVSDELNS
jgi:ankyrin repeat protein